MSQNQSRADSATQYKKTGRSGLNQQRSFSGGGGNKGGGGGATAPHLSSNQSRSFNKYNNAQGGQSRAGGPSLNSDFNNQTTIQNGAGHVQQPSPGASEALVMSAPPVKLADVASPKTTRAVPKGPSSNIPEASTPATPAKAPGFSLQFGSISPGIMNGMHIPARTSSAPPNLDEQKRDQARHEASRTAPAPALPTPSISKQQLPKRDGGTVDHSNIVEVHSVSQLKREGQASAVPTGTLPQKPSVPRIQGMPMQMPFHQSQVPLQFAGPTPQIQSQAMSGTSMAMPMPMPMPMALPLGNPQVQQPVLFSGIQPHLMQPQGLMHQGQGLNFSSPMGAQMPPQLGNMGINMGPQFPQQQAGKVGGPRKVKITHPDTREELRFDASSGPRSHPNMPSKSQPIPSVQHAPMSYYPSSYSSGSQFYPAPGSAPVQISPSSQPPRLYSQVTVKSAGGTHGEKDIASLLTSPAVVMVEPPKASKPSVEDSVFAQKNSETSSMSYLQHLKPGLGPSTNDSKQSAEVVASISLDSSTPNSLSLSAAPAEDSAAGKLGEKICEPKLVEDHPKKPVDIDRSIVQDQVGGGSSVASTVSREVLESGIGTSKTATFGVSDPETLPEVLENLTMADRSVPGSKSLMSSDPTSLESSKNTGQIESRSFLKLSGISNEGSSSESADGKLEDSAGNCTGYEKGGDTVVVSTPISDDKDALNCPSIIDRSASDAKTSTLNTPASIQSHVDLKEASDASSYMSNQDSTSVLVPSPSEDNFEDEEEVSEIKSSNSVSDSFGVKEKSLLEPNVTKNAVSKAKKRRELIKKADAAGATSDLYMAYKGPEEEKNLVTSVELESTETTFTDNIKQTSGNVAQEDVIPTEKASQTKVEPDDWEDAAEFSTPKLGTPQNVKNDCAGEGVGTIKYSRDFLLKFSEQFTDLPAGFEISSDIADVVMVPDANFSRNSDPSFGNRPMSGSRPDRRGDGMGEEEKWNKVGGPLASGRDIRLDMGPGAHGMGLRPGQGGNFGVLRNHPRAQMQMPPLQYPGAILSGPMQAFGPQGGLQKNNSDSDRWQRGTSFQKGLIPYPQTPPTPLQTMHRAEKKYQINKIADEEETKQRQLKGILNKLTPQNFEKLFEQVKQVNIDNAVTLAGVISQIFDKALMEPTFCEMYANFCYHLAVELPDLSVDNEKITFKRLLLNKCQEEFERGEREQEEANKADEEGEIKLSEEEREEKRLRARRRMLGNIRLIGELYKKKMLTERIMHECIKKLLGGPGQIPDEEDLEALCKLMSTIGEMIDHPKAKEHMDAYFDMMAKLSTNSKLSSRVRFMLRDAIDLRKNKWQQRRKVEGPKKIDEVHRDAAQEKQAQANRLARTPSMGSSARRGQTMDYAPRGSSVFASPTSQFGGLRAVPPQMRGFGGQDARFGERHPLENRTLSVPLHQRTDDSITLGPQGGLGRGMSFRGQQSTSNIALADLPSPGDSRRVASGLNGYNSVPERAAYGSREDPMPRYTPERFASPSTNDQSSMQERNMNYANRDARNVDRGSDRTPPISPLVRGVGPTLSHTSSLEKVWPEERLRDMSMATIKEFYSANDENEVILCIKDLNSPSFHPSMISLWVTDSFERKDMERDLLSKLLVNLAKSRDCVLSQDQLIKGFESVLMTLEDAVNDAPKATEFLGRMFAKVISENVIPLSEIGRLIYEGGEEQGSLVEIGLAADVIGSIFETIKLEKGDSVLTEIRTGSNLSLESFRPRGSNKPWRLDNFISKS